MMKEYQFTISGNSKRLFNCISTGRYKSTGSTYIVLAANLEEKLGSPDYISFHVSDDGKLLGIKASKRENPNARKLMNRGARNISKHISCTALLHDLGINLGCRLPAQYDSIGKMVIINIKEADDEKQEA